MNKQYLVTLDEDITQADPAGMLQRLALPGVQIIDFMQSLFIVIARIVDAATAERVRSIHGVVAVEEDRQMNALGE